MPLSDTHSYALPLATGRPKQRITTGEPNVERIISYGTLDDANTDLMHFQDGSIMMVLPVRTQLVHEQRETASSNTVILEQQK